MVLVSTPPLPAILWEILLVPVKMGPPYTSYYTLPPPRRLLCPHSNDERINCTHEQHNKYLKIDLLKCTFIKTPSRIRHSNSHAVPEVLPLHCASSTKIKAIYILFKVSRKHNSSDSGPSTLMVESGPS